MKLHVVTIVLDGMPTIPALFFSLNHLDQLGVDWTWHVSEGAAANVRDTSWCRCQEPRYSTDGTHEFLTMLFNHPRVKIHGKKMWEGKVEMVNDPLQNIREECVLLQCDADELWTPQQLGGLVDLFDNNPTLDAAMFFCRYFVGVNILSTTPNSYGNKADEWARAWRFYPGDKFVSHEPPQMNRKPRSTASRETTRKFGLVFDHYSWAFPNQVAYKEQFYGFDGACYYWQRLQENKQWPCSLKTFLPWVDRSATADKI